MKYARYGVVRHSVLFAAARLIRVAESDEMSRVLDHRRDSRQITRRMSFNKWLLREICRAMAKRYYAVVMPILA